jgi:ribosomal protein S18 acetylase RimI-like enzyme
LTIFFPDIVHAMVAMHAPAASLHRCASRRPTSHRSTAAEAIANEITELVRAYIALPRALLVAELDGVLIGSLIAAWDGWRGSFYRLAVSPEYRRKGLATTLLREGERRLRERGAVRLTAIVADDEDGAMAFWRAAGYEPQRHRARFVRESDAWAPGIPGDDAATAARPRIRDLYRCAPRARARRLARRPEALIAPRSIERGRCRG